MNPIQNHPLTLTDLKNLFREWTFNHIEYDKREFNAPTVRNPMFTSDAICYVKKDPIPYEDCINRVAVLGAQLQRKFANTYIKAFPESHYAKVVFPFIQQCMKEKPQHILMCNVIDTHDRQGFIFIDENVSSRPIFVDKSDNFYGTGLWDKWEETKGPFVEHTLFTEEDINRIMEMNDNGIDAESLTEDDMNDIIILNSTMKKFVLNNEQVISAF